MTTATQDTRNRYALRGMPVRVIRNVAGDKRRDYEGTIESFNDATSLLVVKLLGPFSNEYRTYRVEHMSFGLGGASGIQHIRYAYVA